MGFGDWLSELGGGISDFFGGGGGGGVTAPEVPTTSAQALSGVGVGATPTPDVGAGSGGGGFWSSLGSGLSDLGGIAKSALPIAQLGATGMGIYGGIQNMRQGSEQMDILKRQQRQQEALAAPASAAGAALTGAGSQALLGGALPPAQEKMVEQYAEQIRQQYQQYLANIGMQDSSAAAQMESFVQQQVAAYRTQLANSLYGAGLQGIGTALGPSSAVSQTAAGIAGGSQQQVAGANSALAKLLGSQA